MRSSDKHCVTILDAPGHRTLAERHALKNYASNLAAMDDPSDCSVIRTDVEWVLGRDAVLTARDADGRWWSGCSVPRAAAAAQLKQLDAPGAVACFLAPPHAAAIRVALEKLRPDQAIVAVVPDNRDLQVMLHCEDFSPDLVGHRLWFVGGDDWVDDLRALYSKETGLSLPAQFIRLHVTGGEVVEQLISAAQKVFSDVTSARAERMRELRQRRSTVGSEKLLLLAGSRFRLWSDWGVPLVELFAGDANITCLNPDDPANASHLALATAAATCDAIVAVDLFRADAQEVVSEDTPWVTLSTGSRIAQATGGAGRDLLILFDEPTRSAAVRLGWPESRTTIARPPVRERSSNEADRITIIADTLSLAPPSTIDDFSSHRPLWEYVANELTRNPFAIGDDPAAYVADRMRKFAVTEQTLNRERFTNRLIVPAYQQGLARLLVTANLPLAIYGHDWDGSDTFSRSVIGPVRTRDAFRQALDGSKVLLHVWPERRAAHPIDFAGRSVVRPAETPQRFLRDIRDALSARLAPTKTCAPLFSPEFIRNLLAKL
jgi:hypothetical protein